MRFLLDFQSDTLITRSGDGYEFSPFLYISCKNIFDSLLNFQLTKSRARANIMFDHGYKDTNRKSEIKK